MRSIAVAVLFVASFTVAGAADAAPPVGGTTVVSVKSRVKVCRWIPLNSGGHLRSIRFCGSRR